jgi:hypothetical protein
MMTLAVDRRLKRGDGGEVVKTKQNKNKKKMKKKIEKG